MFKPLHVGSSKEATGNEENKFSKVLQVVKLKKME